MRGRTFSVAIGVLSCIAAVGCGDPRPEGTPPTVSSIPGSCELLTAEEIRTATGFTTGPGRPDERAANVCQWVSTAGEDVGVTLGVSRSPAATWEEFRRYMIEGDYGDPADDGEHVDIGAFGYLKPIASILQVTIEGGVLITVWSEDGDRATLMDLAQRAMSRIR